MTAPLDEALQELDLKITVSLRLLGHFAVLHRRWPANGTYIELIKGLESHLEYWEAKRQSLKDQLRSDAVGV